MTRRLNFPKFELTRLPAPEHTVMPKDAKYEGVMKHLKKSFEENLKKAQDNFPQKVFTQYSESDCAYAIQVYADWSELQQSLALLMIKPKAIERIYTDYQNTQNLATLEVADVEDKQKNGQLITIEKADFVFDDFDNQCGYFSRKINILNHYMPCGIRLAIWRLLTTGFLTPRSDIQINNLGHGVYDLLIDYPKQGFDIAMTLLPLFHQYRVYILTICSYLDSYICVPYVLVGMNAKTRRYNAHEFIDNFPETFYNELVYILFTKPTNDWYKDAHKNAKKLLGYMIDEQPSTPDYLTQLYAAIARYEATINDSLMTDFIEQYIENYQQITQQKKAKVEAKRQTEINDKKPLSMAAPNNIDINIDINNDGIPYPLLNTDWQKQTRKRKFQLDETIWNKKIEATASKQIPILDALTAPIVASTNQPLSIEAFEQLLLMLKLSVEDKPIPALAEVLPALTSESLAHLADELWHDYVENRVSGGYSAYFPEEDDPRVHGIFNTKNKWFMTASAWMADETLADKVWRFMKDYESESFVRSSVLHSFKVLSALASTYPDSTRGDIALKMLIKISNKARSTLRPHAQSALEDYAKRLDLSLEDLAERLLPDFGLDARGTKIINYNPSATDSRKLTISLTQELKFTYQDETGKSHKTPPKAREIDDSDAVNEFLNQHKDEKKELRGISTDLPKTLEKMMISQRTFTLADFMTYYVHHPVMTVLTQRLLWQVQVADDTNDKSDENKQTFRVSESLELLDRVDTTLNDKELNDAQVVLVHPIYLSATDVEQWAEVFSDYELIQPFSQLSRPLYYLTDAEKADHKIKRFDEVHFARGSLMGLASPAKGWEGFSHGRGDYHGFSKNINGHQVSINLYDGFPMWDKVPDDDKGHRIETINLPKDIDELTVSEFLRDINEMARVS